MKFVGKPILEIIYMVRRKDGIWERPHPEPIKIYYRDYYVIGWDIAKTKDRYFITTAIS